VPQDKLTEVEQLGEIQDDADSDDQGKQIHYPNRPGFEDFECQSTDADADYPAKRIAQKVGGVGYPHCENELYDFKRQGCTDNWKDFPYERPVVFYQTDIDAQRYENKYVVDDFMRDQIAVSIERPLERNQIYGPYIDKGLGIKRQFEQNDPY
jgi:hypothetical protein